MRNYALKISSKAISFYHSIAIKIFIVFVVFGCLSSCRFIDDLEDVLKDKEEKAQPHLELIAEGLTAPLMVTEAPDGSGNLFVVEQTGLIKIITPDGKLKEDPFLDIRDKVIELNPNYDERGLLGLAFHPRYAHNGRLYVFYSAPLREEAPDDWDHTNYVSEFRVPVNTPKVDPSSEKVIFFQDHPYSNHNGGTLAFGPHDRYLYISIGDGGNRDDQGIGHVPDWYKRNVGGNGQDVEENLLGNILRIDVDGGDPYGIPDDNPFIGNEGLDEIYAYGMRNPYRFSFDMEGRHTLYSQDAGQGLREEINLVEKGGNYGWNVKEGTLCFDASSPLNPYEHCPEVDPWGNPLLDPVIQFKTGEVGLVVVGGFVYRGDEIPAWKGKYIFGTWSTTHGAANGVVFISEPEMESLWDFEEVDFVNHSLSDLNVYLLGFGQDSEGEVYVLTAEEEWPQSNTGKIYKIVGHDKSEQHAGIMSSFPFFSLK